MPTYEGECSQRKQPRVLDASSAKREAASVCAEQRREKLISIAVCTYAALFVAGAVQCAVDRAGV